MFITREEVAEQVIALSKQLLVAQEPVSLAWAAT